MRRNSFRNRLSGGDEARDEQLRQGPERGERLPGDRQRLGIRPLENDAVLREPVHASATIVRLDPALPDEFIFPARSETSRALIYQAGGLAAEAATPADLRARLATLARAE